MYNISVDRYFNTWSTRSPAVMVFLPARFLIVPGAYSFAEGTYSEFPFSEKIKLYEHDHEGRYLRLRMEHAGTVLQLQYWKPDPWTVRGRLEVIEYGEWGLRFMPTLAFGFEEEGQVKRQGESFDLSMRSYHFGIAFADKPVRQCLAATSSYMGEEMVKSGYYTPFLDAEQPCYLNTTFNLEETPVIDFAVAVTNHSRTAVEKARQTLSLTTEDLNSIKSCLHESLAMEGRFSSCAEALRDVMSWNAIADHYNGRVFTSLTRFWIDKKFGGWFLWLDDVFYHALVCTWSGDWQMAENNLKAAMDNAVPAGNMACLMAAFTEWVDRSQPPVFSFMVWKYYQLTHDLSMLKRCFPTLYASYNWWFANRDGNQNGVLEYGSSNDCGDGHFKRTKLACKDEAAMDNSPMHDPAVFVEETGTLDMEDIALNSLLVLDAESLAKIADVLGETEKSAFLRTNMEQHKKRIDARLWDEERGIYANRLWSGEFASPSPTSFYPLAAGIPSKERADILVKHIFDESKFWTKAPLPSIWLQDEAVHDDVYWRGRMWPPLNFFTYLGLKRYGYAEEARKLAEKSAEVFVNAFDNERSCYENYNTFTGIGRSVDADPFYGWGALLPLIWVMNFLDSTDQGFDFAACDGEPMVLRQLKTYMGTLDLLMGDETTLKLDDKIVFVSDARGRFRDFQMTDNYASVTVPAQQSETYVEFPSSEALLLKVNGEDRETTNRIQLAAGKEHIVELWY